jgi:hypothetical protein
MSSDCRTASTSIVLRGAGLVATVPT